MEERDVSGSKSRLDAAAGSPGEPLLSLFLFGLVRIARRLLVLPGIYVRSHASLRLRLYLPLHGHPPDPVPNTDGHSGSRRTRRSGGSVAGAAPTARIGLGGR